MREELAAREFPADQLINGVVPCLLAIVALARKTVLSQWIDVSSTHVRMTSEHRQP